MKQTNTLHTPRGVGLRFFVLYTIIVSAMIVLFGSLSLNLQEFYSIDPCNYYVFQFAEFASYKCEYFRDIESLSSISFFGSIIIFVIMPLIIGAIIVFYNWKGSLFYKYIDASRISPIILFYSIIMSMGIFWFVFYAPPDDHTLRRFRLFLLFPGQLVFNSVASLAFSFALCTPLLLALKSTRGDHED